MYFIKDCRAVGVSMRDLVLTLWLTIRIHYLFPICCESSRSLTLVCGTRGEPRESLSRLHDNIFLNDAISWLNVDTSEGTGT